MYHRSSYKMGGGESSQKGSPVTDLAGKLISKSDNTQPSLYFLKTA